MRPIRVPVPRDDEPALAGDEPHVAEPARAGYEPRPHLRTMLVIGAIGLMFALVAIMVNATATPVGPLPRNFPS
jgi:hypothetical protein